MEDCYTITFGDRGENHVGMQIIGTEADKGFNYEDLRKTYKKMKKLNIKCELICLNDYIENYNSTDAYILILRNPLPTLFENDDIIKKLYKEQQKLIYDKKALMRGRVVNKIARHNIMFGEEAQEPEYETGKGRIIPFTEVKYLNKIKNKLSEIIDGGNDLIAEGNHYYDLNKTTIGFHGDTERKKVIALRLGSSFPLWFRWYTRFKPISDEIEIKLNNGDMYIMSEKAVGTDWKKSSQITLRHAAGMRKNIFK